MAERVAGPPDEGGQRGVLTGEEMAAAVAEVREYLLCLADGEPPEDEGGDAGRGAIDASMARRLDPVLRSLSDRSSGGAAGGPQG